MTGVSVSVELDTAAAAEALARLTPDELDYIAYGAGQLIENQTKERITTGKASPDGVPWAPWSKAYGETRRPGQSLLLSEGHLLTSIKNYTQGDVAEVGTPLVQGAIHQFGGAGAGKPGLPARPFLGLSEADRREIDRLVIDTIGELLA
ncbi:phage virion morphogenesis protein [Albidovulum sp.]|uniref:phage virion morphogenesis protein n=1 Tax=Albidovulum sp. TaxID=1872424 RepID=UPI0039B99A21